MVTKSVKLAELQKGTLDHEAQRRGFKFSIICHESPATTVSGILLKVSLPDQIELPSGQIVTAEQALQHWIDQREDRVAILSPAEADAFGKRLRPEQPRPTRDRPERRGRPSRHGGTISAFDINDHLEAT